MINFFFHQRVEKLWKKSLEGQIDHLQEISPMPNSISAILEAARNSRNELAHEIAMSVGDKLDSELEARIKEIGTLVEKIAVADKHLALLMHSVNKDPLPSPEFLSHYEERVTGWVCEDTFEDSSSVDSPKLRSLPSAFPATETGHRKFRMPGALSE